MHFNLGTEEMEVSYCGVCLVVVVSLFGLSGDGWAQWGGGVAGGAFPSKAESVKLYVSLCGLMCTMVGPQVFSETSLPLPCWSP